MSPQPISILLIEDNPDHAELTMTALKRGRLANQIFWVKDGEEALHYVFREGIYGNGASAPKPGLIMLDIRLPKVDGLEVLRQIKTNKELCAIPVVMLTTSDRPEEVEEAYRLGANSYITKPVRFADFIQKLETVELYWLLTNTLPDR